MRWIRSILFVASVGLMALVGGEALFGNIRSAEKIEAYILLLYSVLNCIYLIKCAPAGTGKSGTSDNSLARS